MFEKLRARLGFGEPAQDRTSPGETIDMEPHDPDSRDSNLNPIVMYTTRFCPYCMRARSLLDGKGWVYEDIAVDVNPGLREEMIRKSGRHTVPQIWIGERHIGGCDELVQLEMTGQLDPIAFGEQK